MSGILFITQFVLGIILTIFVLLQKSSSIGLGAYSGSNESVFGAKGPTSFLAKATFTIGFLFVVNTISLGYFYNKANTQSIMDSMGSEEMLVPKTRQEQGGAAEGAAPAAPSAPKSE